jgi:hypothetical protein
MVQVVPKVITLVSLILAIVAAGFIIVMSFIQVVNKTQTTMGNKIIVKDDPSANVCTQGKAFVDNRPLSIRFTGKHFTKF